MSSPSKSLHLSSSFKEEFMVTKKQGILSILVSDYERTKSLRRTLSADMSSKKWQTQQGFSPLKKIASSDEFPVSITHLSSEGQDEDEEERLLKDTDQPRRQFDIWNLIQEEKQKQEPAGHFDIWSSLMTQKAQQKAIDLLPYNPRLVKNSTSSLSDKSLEICTERLGSETGSDGFSSYPPSETGDAEEADKEEEQEESQKYDMKDWRVAKYNLATASKKSPPRSFPPPLPSLSRRDGASVHMRRLRDNGRLVLQAVSVTSQNNFRAERQDGRLVLSFIKSPNEKQGPKGGEMSEEKNNMEMFEVEIENSEDEEEIEEEGTEEEEEEEEAEMEMEMEMQMEMEMEMKETANKIRGGSEEVRFVMEQAPKYSSGVINVQRLALMMNKPMGLANRNPTWPNKSNEMVKFEKGVEEVANPITPLTQLLPPRPSVARMISIPSAAVAAIAKATPSSSFNAYEYYWKPKPMATVAAPSPKPNSQKPLSMRSKDNNDKSTLSERLMVNDMQQELVLLRGNKGDCLVSLLEGCKEPRRSLLFWEPYCITTS